MATRRITKRWLVPMVLLGLSAVGLAGTAPAAKLPPDYVFPQGTGSPGKVTFRHSSHVDAEHPRCTTCHPRLFRMLEPGTTADGRPIRHATMERGGQCGACHNSKTAFGLEDCRTCHAEE